MDESQKNYTTAVYRRTSISSAISFINSSPISFINGKVADGNGIQAGYVFQKADVQKQGTASPC